MEENQFCITEMKSEPLEEDLVYTDESWYCYSDTEGNDEKSSYCIPKSTFTCCLCGTLLQSQQQYFEHVNKSHHISVKEENRRELKCYICLREFSTADELEKHQSKVEQVRYQCISCPFVRESIGQVTEHFQQAHTIKIEDNGLSLSSYSEIQLEDITAKSEDNLINHPNFEAEYVAKSSSDGHSQKSDNPILPRQKTDNKCNKCLQSFRSLKGLTRHQQYPLSCSQCAFETCDREVLRAHQRLNHNEGRPYECGHCGRRFAAKYNMAMHIMMHSSKRPFKCELCGKGFILNKYLQRHLLSHHSTEKPLSCQLCAARFKFVHDLTAHLRIHSNEKPYKCSYCTKLFRNSSNRSRHEKYHRDERPHKCDICGSAFREKPKLKIHQRIHSGEEPYSCSTCSKRFRYREHYNKHVKLCS